MLCLDSNLAGIQSEQLGGIEKLHFCSEGKSTHTCESKHKKLFKFEIAIYFSPTQTANGSKL